MDRSTVIVAKLMNELTQWSSFDLEWMGIADADQLQIIQNMNEIVKQVILREIPWELTSEEKGYTVEAIQKEMSED